MSGQTLVYHTFALLIFLGTVFLPSKLQAPIHSIAHNDKQASMAQLSLFWVSHSYGEVQTYVIQFVFLLLMCFLCSSEYGPAKEPRRTERQSPLTHCPLTVSRNAVHTTFKTTTTTGSTMWILKRPCFLDIFIKMEYFIVNADRISNQHYI